MRSTKVIHVVNCHAEGEVGDVIVGGVTPPPGKTLWEQRKFLAEDQALRSFILNEPRGGVFKHVNLLVPPKNPKAQMGFIIMEPEDTPPMSGSNCICVSTVLLETGIFPMTEPETHLTLEAPAGLVEVYAKCKNGKVESITLHNVPSFAYQLDVPLKIDNLGVLTVDLAYGGDSFVIVEIEPLGLQIKPNQAHELAQLGKKITQAANQQFKFQHPSQPGWNHISFCAFTGALKKQGTDWHSKSAVVVQPGKIDRSPTGTALSARMAVMRAKGQMQVGERLILESIIGSQFTGQIIQDTTVGKLQAIVPSVTGRGWITGIQQHFLDPADPWPLGYKINDTWPQTT